MLKPIIDIQNCYILTLKSSESTLQNLHLHSSFLSFPIILPVDLSSNMNVDTSMVSPCFVSRFPLSLKEYPQSESTNCFIWFTVSLLISIWSGGSYIHNPFCNHHISSPWRASIFHLKLFD